jgi:hypothetical protein
MVEGGAVILLFVAFMAALVGVVAYQLWYAPAAVAERALRAMPATSASGLRPGERVKVTGRIVLRAKLTSPFGGSTCAYWLATVEEKAGKDSWRTLVERWEGRGFWVDDGTERVWVDPDGEKLPLRRESAGRSGTFDDPSSREAQALAELGVDPTGLLGFNRTLRFHESSLDEDERVSVAGVVKLTEIDGVPALSLVGGEEGLLVSDALDIHG